MMQLGGGTPTTTAAATTVATATAPPPQSNNNDSAATEAAAAAVGAFEVSEEMHDRGFGGNRWPRQETLALLKIRSDMGIAFRDASVKGPLWEEVSRKMAEHGYIRNAKKCKEKFENVYKYHKRTKEGRTGKSEGKTYRFFDQLEALESQSTTSLHHHQQQTPLRPQQNNNNNNNNNNSSIFSTPPPVTTVMPTLPSSSIPPYTQQINVPSFPNISGDFLSDNSTSSSSSYSTSSDMEMGGGTATTRKKRKRKWKVFFERLMKQVVDKQEELQRKFLEAVEKREHERLVREESWRVQEIARINREHEILAQERSMSAAKDAAVMAFLQKLSEKQPNQPQPQPQPQQVRPSMQLNNNNQQQPPQRSPPPQPPAPLPQPIQAVVSTLDTTKTDNGGDQNMTPAASASSSRWPKVEIEALIKLRTNLDSKYQENGPKGPLWEEISAGMRRLGFNRNSKRCKEKWENINKYFKKVKESNKKRPEDSKTCPYFHQLDALYRERNKFHSNNNIAASSSSSGLVKPDNSVPLMVQPEQQWPPAVTTATTTPAAAQPDQQSQPSEQNFDDEEGTDEEYDDEDEEEENEEEEGGEFELVPSNNNNNKTTNNL
ncbi:Myb-like domain [Arabidopsis suecica]|uniref:Myb-like domain n=1 Tax=Arabidopsis suecica TaxID=45249 RepID=A0A8T2HIF3_ARASU|nr:Myb-like domain [Arabidopsis suecica]